jgi:hypothetical protein
MLKPRHHGLVFPPELVDSQYPLWRTARMTRQTRATLLAGGIDQQGPHAEWMF